VRIVCVTLGEQPPGPEGAGTLYSLVLTPKATGSTTLGLNRVVLSNPPGDEIASSAQPLDVEVEGGGGGINWAIWGPVIGVSALVIIAAVVVLAILARRGQRSSAPAPAD
jgi:hypothetical protein